MEEWKSGRMEEWKNGIVEEWKNGRMEYWKNGKNFGFRTFYAAKPHACPVFSRSSMCVRLRERVISDTGFLFRVPGF